MSFVLFSARSSQFAMVSPCVETSPAVTGTGMKLPLLRT
jgi:hypothetical protein